MVKPRPALALLFAAASAACGSEPKPATPATNPSAVAIERPAPQTPFRLPFGGGPVRGITVGPIESSLHPNKGYGSDPYQRTVDEVVRLGGTWVSLTPFGRVWDLHSTGVDLTFEKPFEENREALRRAIDQAHASGLRVMLVPHLWVETGGWRALIDPKTDEGWEAWQQSYQRFVLTWATLAEETHVDLLSVGVELRSWVTTNRAPSFQRVIKAVRGVYSGPLTYAANWDDVEHTVILGDLDVIGINAFYPLADKDGAGVEQLRLGGAKIAERVGKLAAAWRKPVLFTEIGYTTRKDPAIKPWEWPDHMKDVVVDEQAQADAYEALISPMLDQSWFAGFFVWRFYADPDDMSQEAEWGFSPRGKLAEAVVRDAFRAHWYTDGPRPLGAALTRNTAKKIGVF